MAKKTTFTPNEAAKMTRSEIKAKIRRDAKVRSLEISNYIKGLVMWINEMPDRFAVKPGGLQGKKKK